MGRLLWDLSARDQSPGNYTKVRLLFATELWGETALCHWVVRHFSRQFLNCFSSDSNVYYFESLFFIFTFYTLFLFLALGSHLRFIFSTWNQCFKAHEEDSAKFATIIYVSWIISWGYSDMTCFEVTKDKDIIRKLVWQLCSSIP